MATTSLADDLLAPLRWLASPIVGWWARQGGLYFAADFLAHCMLFRVAWIRGRLGGGKTLLAVALAHELFRLNQIEGVIANFPTIFPPALGADDGTLINRAVLYDEAWQEFDSRDSLVNARYAGAYARKMGVYWIFPSVHPVDKRLRSVIAWRAAILPFGIWVYRWTLELDYDNAGGWFLLVKPARYFRMYDTRHIPADDAGIQGRFDRTIDLLTQGEGIQEVERLRDYLDALAALGDEANVFGVVE